MAVPHLESKLSVGGGRSGECSLWSHRWPPPPKHATKSHGIPQWLLASQCGTQNLMETGKSGNLTVHEINSECWEMPSSPVCSGTRQSSQLFHPNRGGKAERACVSMDRKDCHCSLKWRLYHHHTAPIQCFRSEWGWGLRGAKARKISSYTHLPLILLFSKYRISLMSLPPSYKQDIIFVLKNLQLQWEVRAIKNLSALCFPSLALINLICSDPVSSKIHQQTVNVCDSSKIQPPVGRWLRR